MNICLCGSEAGQLHAVDCPYPQFNSTDLEARAWLAARKDRAQRMGSEPVGTVTLFGEPHAVVLVVDYQGGKS